MYNERKNPMLCLKLNVPRALFNGEKVNLDACPVKSEGKTLIPKCALKLIGIDCEDDYASLESVEGLATLENEMGLIFIDNEPVTLTVENDLAYMLSLAHRFIFEIEVGKLGAANDYAPATDEERASFKRVGGELLDILLKRENKHPFLFGTQEIFNKLREVYASGEGQLFEYLDKLVKRADKLMENFPKLNDTRNGFATEFPSSGYGETEYDVGGRHSESEGRLNDFSHIALAYQLTLDDTYALVAYYGSLEIIKRKHWGPGHFLNCSGATSYLSIVYDFLYNAWRALGLDTGAIKAGIYAQGLHHGFNSAVLDMCDFPSPKQGTGWRFRQKCDNWNSVCNSGMVVGSLCVLAEGVDDIIDQEKYDKVTELLGACITSTMQPQLMFTQYAPDGSYIESNSYWGYGTTNLVNTMAALYDSLGTDLGLHHACGFDRTCYYAINAESAEYVGWNYHDGGTGAQSTSCFNQVATISGDVMLYTLRDIHVKNGKNVHINDVLYHPVVRNREMPKLDALPLDYAMVGIDAFTVRNGWERGSLYAGMIGGYNPSGGSHNQLDSGAFVYHNLGKMWFTDLGSDYYNSRGIKNGLGYFSNYGLYRRNAEGNNCLCLTSLPFGQRGGATGHMTEYKSDDTASYNVIDNREIYGDDKVEYAKRGMLLINNRRTLVIKDELKLTAADTVFTTAHFESDKITALLSEDGRKCTLTHKDGEKIYVTLQGDGKLELMNCTDPLLTGTEPAEGEYSRENFSRLVVKHDNVTTVNTAFIIDTEDHDSYDIPDIEMWKTL
jgi:hypothetical protein